MKIIWKGSIIFGIVDIPINLYSATESHALGFTLLHETCKTPLKYHRWCPHCKKEVVWSQTVKGIKQADDSYIVVTKELLSTLRPEKSDALQIIEFIDHNKLDSIYLNNHYYVSPAKNAHAYGLFLTALENLSKFAIGKFVMRDKEHICVLQPYNHYLLLTTLHYAYEIKNIEQLALTKPTKLKPAEVKLAEELIKKLSVHRFDVSKLKDTFAQQLKKLITEYKHTKGKRKSKRISHTKVPITRKKPNLTSALRMSIENIKPAAHAKGHSRKIR